MYESSRNARLFILYRLAYLSMRYFFLRFSFGNICKEPYFIGDLTTSLSNDYFLFRLLSFFLCILCINKSIRFGGENCIIFCKAFVFPADCLISRVRVQFRLYCLRLELLEVFVVIWLGIRALSEVSRGQSCIKPNSLITLLTTCRM